MPWVLQNLVDGQPPGAWRWIAEGALNGLEGVITQENPSGKLWDAASESLRDPTAAEVATEQDQLLSAAKMKKRLELVRDADNAYKAEIPSFAGVVVAAKYGRGVVLSPAEQAVFNKINAGYTRLNTLLSQVDAATTLDEVGQIQW